MRPCLKVSVGDAHAGEGRPERADWRETAEEQFFVHFLVSSVYFADQLHAFICVWPLETYII